MRATPLFLFLFCLPLGVAAQAPESHGPIKPFLISVDQPAFIGEPIWVNERTRPTQYSSIGGECNRLELLYDGKAVPPWPVKPVFVGGSGSTSWPISFDFDCNRSELYNPSPGKRIPLHIWFHIQQPGQYALRWNYEWPEFQGNKVITKRASSDWITFTVQAPTAEGREKWLRTVLAQPNQSSVDLLGNYIPSLVAAAPDERALNAIVAKLYSFDRAAAMASEALAFFPDDHVKTAIYEMIRNQGPTDFLAHLVSWNSLGLDDDPNQRAQVTRTCFRYLRNPHPDKVAAAIEMILFNVHGKNPTPTDPKLIAQADNEVLDASADIAATGQENTQRELILYMRCIKTPEGRQRLVSMAQSHGPASDIANTALIFDHAPEANGPLLLEVKIHSDMPHGIEIARSWSLTITNLTDTAVTIQRGIAIERRTSTGWKQDAGVQAVANCQDYVHEQNWKSPVHISAHSSLAVQPWNGFVCGGQCEANCLQNVFSGPGIVRFVVVLLPDGKRIASLPFAIPKS